MRSESEAIVRDPIRRPGSLASRLLIIPLAAIVFGAALGAGFQWGGPTQQDAVRVYDTTQRTRVGGDGGPIGNLTGFVTETSGDTWVVRVGDDLRTVRFDQDAVVEALLPIWTDDAQLGDYIVVGGTDDNVNTFITTGIVVIPAAQAQTGQSVVEAIQRDATSSATGSSSTTGGS